MMDDRGLPSPVVSPHHKTDKTRCFYHSSSLDQGQRSVYIFMPASKKLASYNSIHIAVSMTL